jgi:hypothetical protein
MSGLKIGNAMGCNHSILYSSADNASRVYCTLITGYDGSDV